MAEVVIMNQDYNQKHLDKITIKIQNAYTLKAKCYAGRVKMVSVEKVAEIIDNLKRQYNFYKQAYGL